MSNLTIRNLDDAIKAQLRIRAAAHGHSMEEEVRIILRQAVSGINGNGLYALSRQLFGGQKGIEALPIASRKADRALPHFNA